MFGRTYAGAQKAMRKLVDLGILEEHAGNPSRLYVAWSVIRAIDE